MVAIDKDANMEYRQRYARTLYVLMMALVDKEWYPIWDATIARKLEGVDPEPINDIDKAMARARAIACGRLLTSSFCRTLCTCHLAVPTVITRSAAISRLDLPATIK